MATLTPMMQQYKKIKEQYKDAILMYRLGDFYEMFFEDAIIASRELEITLTGRDCGLEERAPMCGVPFHSADTYISRLVSKGYKVAICEQMEDPSKAKGIVKREVVRIITPGTILDENILDSRKTNYIACIYKKGDIYSLSYADISTGEFVVADFKNPKNEITGILSRIDPVEAALNMEALSDKDIKSFFEGKSGVLIFNYDDLAVQKGQEALAEHFGEKLEKIKSINENLLISAGVLIAYLIETQKANLIHISDIKVTCENSFLNIDPSSVRNLELIETMRNKEKKGSLFWVLDKTQTKMGSRLLKKWLLYPLLDITEIKRRQDAVEEGVMKLSLREEIRDHLKYVYDLERLLSKVSVGTVNARDLISLKNSLGELPKIHELIKNFKADIFAKFYRDFDLLSDIFDLIDRAIVDDPPVSLRDGGIIKTGFDEEIDLQRKAITEGKDWVAQIENEEREKTGIKNLKVGFNKVFGYYIEVSSSNLGKVPDYYVRKQTIANGERFITQKLKDIESLILGAEEKITNLEYNAFLYIKDKVAQASDRIQKMANILANIDAVLALAYVASKNNYVKPVVNNGENIIIKDGRHPVVEQTLTDSLFVPNDTYLSSEEFLSVITGPNMAGKSTYMRQCALIVIMAQMGGFVPASYCEVGICDKIFTRVGASDDLATGQSTFMLEMNEVSAILKGATKKSLLILDEIGRGTSTFDGLSIAWSVIEYIALKIKAKTLFATHYHELTELEGKIAGVKNLCVSVKLRGDYITFLRKIVPGGADRSYGIEVAKLAGIPNEVIKRAKEILQQLEESDINKSKDVNISSKIAKAQDDELQVSFGDFKGQKILEEIKKIDTSTLTPIEALNILYRLEKWAKE
ncbi:MAG: DNA mismatch repair protein MutS [Clostridiaceae bacterium]|nr:DNA mismatch repair protein MutS [Clostridiaceae bacterium]